MFVVANEFYGANVSRTIRFTKKLYAELSELAQENNVSFNLLVLQCCKYALDHYGADLEAAK